MSLVYIVVSFFAVLANNVLVEALPLNTRITFGEFYGMKYHLIFTFKEIMHQQSVENVKVFITLNSLDRKLCLRENF